MFKFVSGIVFIIVVGLLVIGGFNETSAKTLGTTGSQDSVLEINQAAGDSVMQPGNEASDTIDDFLLAESPDQIYVGNGHWLLIRDEGQSHVTRSAPQKP